MANLRVDKIASVGVSTETTGSVFFDGTDDILNLPSTSEFNFGTDNFTIEFWIYPTATQPDFAGIIVQGTDSNPSWFVHYNDASPAKLRLTSWDTNILVSTNTPTLNVWTHYAMVREGTGSNEFKMYVNGTLDVTGTYASELGRTTTTHIAGGYSGGSRPKFQGYISNLRIVKGRAIYTSNFAVPTRELEVVDGTVLLCCHDGENIFADKSEKHVIAAIGDRLSSPTPTATDSPIGITTFQPGLTRNVDVTAGPVFQGGAAFTSQNWLTLPKGTTTDRNRTGGRGITGGGNNPANTNLISYFTISSMGNAFDFGDLSAARTGVGACSSSTRGVFAGGGGSPSPFLNTIEYVTIATTGDAVNFGDLDDERRNTAAVSSQTRGVWAGGSKPALDNVIQFITFGTLGNAQNFGDLTSARAYGMAGAESPTRGLFAGGYGGPSPLNGVKTIDFITIASAGNAQTFGDLFTGAYNNAGTSSNTRAIFAGGYNPTLQDNIEYVTISTLGNGQDFGNLIATNRGLRGTSNKIRGVFSGGDTPTITNTLQYITISSTGNAKDFGDLTSTIESQGSCSDSHGGLS
jgi:hypothetical protein